jgi:uroporphyrinogen III methyltransferase / synthase
MIMKVLITRPEAQSGSFGIALQAAGFEPVYFPVIEIRRMEDNAVLDNALARLSSYEWIVFTSVNAVEIVLDRLLARAIGADSAGASDDPIRSSMPRVAAIGPKTAQALRARGIEPFYVPEEYVAEAILPGLGDLRGKRVLLPRAEIARKALPEAIVAAGGRAHEIPVYKTLPAKVNASGLAALKAGVDVITFTSPSTVDNFVEIVRRHGLDPVNLPSSPRVACIGPITESAARLAGFSVAIVAEEYTSEGLIAVIRKLESVHQE